MQFAADKFHWHMLAPNWSLELRSSKNKAQKQIKCGAGFDNSTWKCHAEHEKV
jgi:hypothetical protein